jgi:SAM-dependent methyltransferase
MKTYSSTFYAERKSGANQSARLVVPVVLKLLPCASVIDVGCGTGEWLSVFQEHGVQDIVGVDGEYVDRDLLQIPRDNFTGSDLRSGLTLDRKFDLAVSLEVAEHLPADHASIFVDSLTRLSPVVLFSAAVPFQEGTNHINEQWPDYWVEKFLSRNFVPVDCLRRMLWEDSKIDWWYAQNIMFFVCRDQLSHYPLLQQHYENERSRPLSLIHPTLWEYKANKVAGLEAELRVYKKKWEKLQNNRFLRILNWFYRFFRLDSLGQASE